MYRKTLASQITVIDSDESRITGIQINTEHGPLLLLNVYMPTNYGDEASLELYRECLAKLHALIVDSYAVHTIIAGDFNCSPSSRFFAEFVNFATDNDLLMTDLTRLKDVVTYISDDGSKSSWIDHILCSHVVDSMIRDVDVINDVVISDHKPLSFSVQCSVMGALTSDSYNAMHTADVHSGSDLWVPVWDRCDRTTLDCYSDCVDNLLQQVYVPFVAFDSSISLHEIDQFYHDILACIYKAVHHCIPTRRHSASDFNVPGWNNCVSEKHDAAREAYLCWLEVGKPKFGYHFDRMTRTRAVFKLALRYCKNHIEELKADACAEAVFDKDPRKFWNSVYKMSNSKASCQVNSIGGASGTQNVVNMWMSHFQELYSTVSESKYRNVFQEKVFASPRYTDQLPVLSVYDIETALNAQKFGKAAGPDGIHAEAFIYGGHRLRLYLCLLFNLFLKHGYVPASFSQSIIIPLVKSKSGDLSDVNNYRAIALANSLSKILETVLFEFIASNDPADEYQFGFRKHLSTTLCTQVFKKTVNYYRQHGSHVFTCFIDFNKAFDNVDYWLLFCKLLDSNDSAACFCATRLLACWYSSQAMCIQWQNEHSSFFNIAKGVRQGGILSPFLFRVYIRDFITSISRMNVGCNLAGINVNLLAYADDLVLLAPSWRALQSLLQAAEAAASKIMMTFNIRKTVCMVFNPSCRSKCIADSFPAFTLSGSSLAFVQQFKYLGHIVENTFSDDSDVNREIKCLFSRTNLLCRRFKRCTRLVKIRLFRTYCMCLYDTALWSSFSVGAINRLASCYTKCMKYFFGYSKYSSVTSMLLELGLPSFSTMLHNSKMSLTSRLLTSENVLVQHVVLFKL